MDLKLKKKKKDNPTTKIKHIITLKNNNKKKPKGPGPLGPHLGPSRKSYIIPREMAQLLQEKAYKL